MQQTTFDTFSSANRSQNILSSHLDSTSIARRRTVILSNNSLSKKDVLTVKDSLLNKNILSSSTPDSNVFVVKDTLQTTLEGDKQDSLAVKYNSNPVILEEIPQEEIIVSDSIIRVLPQDSDTTTTIFATNDETFSVAEDQIASQRIEGKVVKYDIQNDTIASIAIFFYLALMLTAFTQCRYLLKKHLENILFPTRNRFQKSSRITVRFIVSESLLMVNTCIILALICYMWTNNTSDIMALFDTQCNKVALIAGIFGAYFIIKLFLYTTVNCLFFNKEKALRWVKILVFLAIVEGILLFPVILFERFTSWINISDLSIYTFVVTVIIKLLAVYNCYAVFFKESGINFHFFLYLCTLEVAPVAALIIVITPS